MEYIKLYYHRSQLFKNILSASIVLLVCSVLSYQWMAANSAVEFLMSKILLLGFVAILGLMAIANNLIKLRKVGTIVTISHEGIEDTRYGFLAWSQVKKINTFTYHDKNRDCALSMDLKDPQAYFGKKWLARWQVYDLDATLLNEQEARMVFKLLLKERPDLF